MGFSRESPRSGREQNTVVAYINSKYGGNIMKKFLYGGFAGYLLTSIFSIPSPPSIFWWIVGLAGAIGSYFYFVVYQFNNDAYGDIDE